MATITASMLYDLVTCPQRVAMDAFAPEDARDPVSEFVQLLWSRGTSYEEDVLARLAPPPLQLGALAPAAREQATLDALRDRVPLIAGGRLRAGDHVGEPDLLRLVDGRYLPLDIKAGRGSDGGDDDAPGKPKPHYSVQLAFYVHLLEQLGIPTARRGIIFDIDGVETIYELDTPRGPRTPETQWDEFEGALAQVERILAGDEEPGPALSAPCKNCCWRTACRAQIDERQDLTLIPELGRAKRDTMLVELPTIHALADASLPAFFSGRKTVFPGVGQATLVRMQQRARLIVSGGAPYALSPITLPPAPVELFFDVETDPLRDLCYLHGVVIRRDGAESFRAPFATESTDAAEQAAFAEAMALFAEFPEAPVYYYSAYERTTYRALQRKYPDVCSAEDIEGLFARAIDLYRIIREQTIWPTNDHSIKTLAKYLGFRWRDTNPSGAASIEWYATWERTREPADRQRILDYNEDDCVAMRVVLDALRTLPSEDGRA